MSFHKALRRSQPPLALAATVLRVPLSRFTAGGRLPRLGGGSAFFVRPHDHALRFMDGCSSEWSYWAPYAPDISAALQRLREDVFARGDYMTEESELASARYLVDMPRLSTTKPSSIAELLEQEGDHGTHSILDINHVSPTPKRRAVSPLPDAVLADYCLSGTPSREEIEDVYEFGSLEKYVNKRWRGIYIIAYKDGKPSEIFFAGCSGD